MTDLPRSVQYALDRLTKTVELREAATSTTDEVGLRAREDILALRVVEALEEAAVAHHAGSFEGLHPRDRLGRWMEKIDSGLHMRLLSASRTREPRSRNGVMRGGNPKEPNTAGTLLLHSVYDPKTGNIVPLNESASIGKAGSNFGALHPRDRLGQFMEKIEPSRKPGTKVQVRMRDGMRKGTIIRHSSTLNRGGDFYVVDVEGESMSRNFTARELGVPESKYLTVPKGSGSQHHGNEGTPRGVAAASNNDTGHRGPPTSGDSGERSGKVTPNLSEPKAPNEVAANSTTSTPPVGSSQRGQGDTSKVRPAIIQQMEAGRARQSEVDRIRALSPGAGREAHEYTTALKGGPKGDDGQRGTPRGHGKPKRMSRGSKAQALVAAGLASDLKDARAQLADMGE